MATKTVTTRTCNCCDKKIDGGDKCLTVKSEESEYVDICASCLEREYHRVCLNEVPTRRGGYRELGSYNG